MPFPTNVTEPRFGVEAFERDDASSQLAQAAFLLLLRNELRLRRGSSTPQAGRVAFDEAWEQDVARFKIPAIPSEGRRYSLDEALGESGIAAHRRSWRDADELRTAAWLLADLLQEEPSDLAAAALIGVCTLSPDPIVRTAAAAAAFEIIAEPTRLLRILAKGARDDDPLVRDLAATALARVSPEHPALRALTRRVHRVGDRERAHTSLLVHGTFARNATWWQPGGGFHGYLHANVLPDLYTGADRFEWSGGYSDAARQIAATDLQAWINSHGVPDPLIVGHSHGANVVLLATQLGVTLSKAVLLSCPVHWPEYAPDFSQVGKVVSVRVHLDLVILADGGDQRFLDSRIHEHVLPVWFNHAATHDRAVWIANNVPAML